MNLSDSDRRLLISTVKAHIKSLGQAGTFVAEEADLRVASTGLRALLVEGMLDRAWRAASFGGPITFSTWCLDRIDPNEGVGFCGGGEVLPNIPVSWGHLMSVKKCNLDLKAFCNQTRIQIRGQKISTLDLVKYVANTRGGAHFDPVGRADKPRSKRAFDALRLLDDPSSAPLGVSLRVNDRDALHHEVLSIIHAVITSPQVVRLAAHAGSPVPETA